MGQLRLGFMRSFIHSSGCGDVYQSPTEPARATHQAGDDERLTRRAARTVAFSMLATSMKK
jgi:hypothetical protein